MKTNLNTTDQSLGWFSRLLIRLSGTEPKELEGLPPAERFKCTILGLSMFVPVLAFLVGAVRAAHAQYGHVPLGEIMFIAIFAAIIFIVDLTLVCTMRKTGSGMRVAVLATFRFGLAAVMAWNIAQPVVIARFNDHVSLELARRSAEKIEGLRSLAREREREVLAGIAPGIADIEKQVALLDAETRTLAAQHERADSEVADARNKYSREITGMNPSGLPKEGSIGRDLRVKVLEPAEARLKRLEAREDDLKKQGVELMERIRKLRDAASNAPALSAIRNDLQVALDSVKNAPPPGTALRAQVLADLWQKNADLRRDVWMYLIWILLLDLTPLLAKLLAPVGSVERVAERREFREIADLATDKDIYPDLAREIAVLDMQQLLLQKQVETELAKHIHLLNGALETVSNLAKARCGGQQKVGEAYGADDVNSPEAQESLGIIENACSSVSEAYSSFLRSKGAV